MKPTGSPAIDLPKFVPVPFSAPRVAMGAAVTTIELESTSAAAQINVPFTFGQSFVGGDQAPGDSLVGRIPGEPDIPLQLDCVASNLRDGSLFYAVVSGVLPALAAKQTKVMTLVRAPATERVTAPLPPLNAAITINAAGGVTYTVKASDVPLVARLAGKVCTEYAGNLPFVDSKGQEHPALTVALTVRHYPATGRACISFAVEHAKVYEWIGDLTYDATITVDGAVAYQKTVTHFLAARWRKAVWVGGEPALHIRHNKGYLIDSRAVANYDREQPIAESLLQSYGAGPAFSPMSSGTFAPGMGMTGGRSELGLAPAQYVAAILSGDKRAKDRMLIDADSAGAWGTHRRDNSGGPGTGRPFSIMYYPYATIVGREGDSYNPNTGKREVIYSPASSSPFEQDSAHQAAFATIPYLVTGDFYYFEELHFWNGYNLYQSNPGYRQAHHGFLNWDQVRGQAWMLRTLADTAALTPDDHPDKAALIYWMNENIAHYTATCTNPLGIITDQAIEYNGKRGIAPWMDDFFTQALGHAVELGFENARPVLQWKAKFQLGRMNAPGVCWTEATVYALNVRDSESSPLYETLAQCYAATIPAAALKEACNTPARSALSKEVNDGNQQATGEMVGYAYTEIGYPSNYQPALAMVVDLGLPGSAVAWHTFIARQVRPDYSKGPQFAVIPRTLPRVDMPPVTAPAPSAPAATPAPYSGPVATLVTAPTAGTWAVIGVENTKIPASAGAVVSYGAGNAWIYAKVDGPFTASNDFFGSDPAFGVVKQVRLFTPAKPTTVTAGKATLNSNAKLAKLKGLTLVFLDATKLVPIKTFSGVSATTKGGFTVSDVSLPVGVCLVSVADSAGKPLDAFLLTVTK